MTSMNSTPVLSASCELYDLVIDMDWDAVAKHAIKHPQDASWEDGEWHETPLFCACQNDPSEEAVRSLLQAYPPAARMGSKNGDLPLHIACRWRASSKVIRALVEHDPSTACVATKFGKTPLIALWEGYTKSNGEEGIYQSTCEKSIVLLEAIARAHGLFTPEAKQPLCLHAAMKMECTDALLYFVLEKYRCQISQCDEKGRLPLHLAVEAGIPSRRKLWRCVFEELIKCYPKGAMTPDPVSGRLPLHTMISNPNYSWAEIEVVFQAHPKAMAERDAATGLLPFAMTTSIETSFCLLTAQPDVLSNCKPLPYQEESTCSSRRPLLTCVGVGLFSVIAGLVIAVAWQGI